MEITNDYSATVRAEIARTGRTAANVRRAVGIEVGAWARRMADPRLWRVAELQAIARELDVPLTTLTGDTE